MWILILRYSVVYFNLLMSVEKSYIEISCAPFADDDPGRAGTCRDLAGDRGTLQYAREANSIL